MTPEPIVRTERIDNATLERLAQAHERVSIRGAGAWDGMDLNDLVSDLMLARAARDRYRARLRHLLAGRREVAERDSREAR